MPNGHGPKEYGGHKYAGHGGTSDCQYDCGCWMGPTNSGGPVGLDPFGTCPKNPTDGKLLGGNADYNHVVNQRIRNLEARLYQAEEQLKRVSPDKIELAEELAATKAELARQTRFVEDLRRFLGTGA